MSGRPPERLGSTYEVLEHLSTGGMADVHRARFVGPFGFEKIVAIKRIRPMLRERADIVAMFLDEAKLAATLGHPNIVEVFDIGLIEGGHFFSMEYVDGATLLDVLRESTAREAQMPLEVAVAIAIGACAGLEHAHQRKVIHCDISPSNLMIRHDGLVKIIDFGIARSIAAGPSRRGLKGGKPGYMSPEQCRGRALDARTDIFSIAIVLYEMIANDRLFAAKTGAEVMQRIIAEEAPPPSAHRLECPSELDWIVGRALRKQPSLRYQTAEHLRRALEAFAERQRWPLAPLLVARYLKQLLDGKPTLTTTDSEPWLACIESSDPTDVDAVRSR